MRERERERERAGGDKSHCNTSHRKTERLTDRQTGFRGRRLGSRLAVVTVGSTEVSAIAASTLVLLTCAVDSITRKLS